MKKIDEVALSVNIWLTMKMLFD